MEKSLEETVHTLQAEVRELRKMVEEMRKVLALVAKSVREGDKQIVVTSQIKDIVAASCEDVKRDIFEALNTHMVPQMKAQVQWLNYQTEDTQEMLTNYQMEQMCGSLKAISGSSGGSLHLGLGD